MKHRLLLVAIFAATALTPLRSADTSVPRPIQLADILAWKRIQTSVVSPNGQWFGYKLSPNEGNSEVLLRNLKDGKEQRFPIGELPRVDFAPGAIFVPPPRDLAFSEDSKWAAFLAYPIDKEAKGLKKQKKPIQSKLILVELATGKKTEFDKIRRFAFSGERSSAIAMHRYAPTPPGPPAAPQHPVQRRPRTTNRKAPISSSLISPPATR